MKQIGIALHNYHDVNKHFPPAVVMGPDGKTPHSWRVEILPYLEAINLQQLSKQYRMDEPWDSEHNKKLIEATDFFSVPGEKPSKDCGYFFAVGPGTAFDPVDKATFRNITDGTSKTIAVVEAKRSIPWTKPEDIEFDPDKPLPKLGGYFGGGFNTLFFDGSVHFLPDDIDEKGLRALVTSRGREIIVNDPQTDTPKVQE
jgi:prepilin-type processing-associated H-X9-DG protein